MDLQVPEATLVALLLGTARSTGFVLLAPPFNSSAIPIPAKGAMALALAVALQGRIAPALPDLTPGFLIVGAVTEVAIGAALGFVVQLLFSAVQMAGDLIDMTGGFSLQPAYDPLNLTMTSNVGRLHYMLASTLLFTSGGHLVQQRDGEGEGERALHRRGDATGVERRCEQDEARGAAGAQQQPGQGDRGDREVHRRLRSWTAGAAACRTATG